MSQATNVEEVVLYSLGRPSKHVFVAGLSYRLSAIFFVAFLTFIFLQIAGYFFAAYAYLLPAIVVYVAAVSLKIKGRSVAENIQMMFQFSRSVQQHRNEYISGPLSEIPGGRRRLPGLLTRTEVISGVDADGQDFAVILDRPRGEATVVFDVQLTGQTATTQEERNLQTAAWSFWLASLSTTGDVRQMAFVVATRPGSGQLMFDEAESVIHGGAPEIAQRIVRETAELISAGIPEVSSHISVTIKVPSASLDDDSFMTQLATQLPNLYVPLVSAGIVAAPMSEDRLVARVHSFYNPAAEQDFEQLDLAGVGHGLSWADAGPSVAVVKKDRYFHDGCWSLSWEMADAPRAAFEDTLLSALVIPHDHVTRKRVALIYRPFESSRGAREVEAEHLSAMITVNSSRRLTSAAAEMRLEHTEAARRASAKGHQLGKYSLFVTATVDDPEQILRTSTEVEHLAAASSIRLRKALYQQDTAFVVSCGLGQVPWVKETTLRSASA